MYKDKDIVRVLKRDLKSEFETIMFYLDNLEKLNYSQNKRKVDKLTLDSIGHAGTLTKEILALSKPKEGKLSRAVLRRALKEETALKEIYKYEYSKTDISRVKTALKQLSSQEEKHEQLVSSLK